MMLTGQLKKCGGTGREILWILSLLRANNAWKLKQTAKLDEAKECSETAKREETEGKSR